MQIQNRLSDAELKEGVYLYIKCRRLWLLWVVISAVVVLVFGVFVYNQQLQAGYWVQWLVWQVALPFIFMLAMYLLFRYLLYRVVRRHLPANGTATYNFEPTQLTVQSQQGDFVVPIAEVHCVPGRLGILLLLGKNRFAVLSRGCLTPQQIEFLLQGQAAQGA